MLQGGDTPDPKSAPGTGFAEDGPEGGKYEDINTDEEVPHTPDPHMRGGPAYF